MRDVISMSINPQPEVKFELIAIWSDMESFEKKTKIKICKNRHIELKKHDNETQLRNGKEG